MKLPSTAAGMLLVLAITAVLAERPKYDINSIFDFEGPHARRLLASDMFLPDAKQLSLLIPLATLNAPPTPPSGYSSGQMRRWKFTSSEGYLLITRNSLGPEMGDAVLTEMFYFPGLYQPVCSSTAGPYLSAQRVWVDQQLSLMVGRTYWGFPKEDATFTWGPHSLTAKSGNTVLFTVTFDSDMDTSLLNLPTWLTTWADTATSMLQWPISDATTRLFIRVITNPPRTVAPQLAMLPEATNM